MRACPKTQEAKVRQMGMTEKRKRIKLVAFVRSIISCHSIFGRFA
jgi:hypothetical protein